MPAAPIEIATLGAAWRPRWLAMSSQSSTVHAPHRLLEHPPKILKPAALGLALSQNVQSGQCLAQVDSACVGRWRIYRYGQPLIAKEARVNHFSV